SWAAGFGLTKLAWQPWQASQAARAVASEPGSGLTAQRRLSQFSQLLDCQCSLKSRGGWMCGITLVAPASNLASVFI
ncbi:hypothetical protein Pcinc_040959, partial [Petrolisthes cinctipes]